MPRSSGAKGLTRLRVAHLLTRLPSRLVWAAFVSINGALTMAGLALASILAGTVFLLPPLGASAFLFFFTPETPSASPRNAVLGYAIGIATGVAALAITGLAGAPPVTVAGVDAARVVAAALSLGACGGAMVLFDAVHPPAGATTLVVSLGLVSKPSQIIALEVAIVLLLLQTIAIHRLAGVVYPLWARARPRVERPTTGL